MNETTNLIPQLKIFNQTERLYIDQSTRTRQNNAITITPEPYHEDIFQFFSLTQEKTEDEKKEHSYDLANALANVEVFEDLVDHVLHQNLRGQENA